MQAANRTIHQKTTIKKRLSKGWFSEWRNLVGKNFNSRLIKYYKKVQQVILSF